jgi:ATP-dependent DNA helicase RecG
VQLRCARYKGVTPITFIDLKVIEGNIIDQIEEAENFVLSHIKRAAKIVGFSREEVWEYPPSALREAIVNAVCHRDYSSTSDITIGILDDRIEISNPGRLPEPLTPAMLKQKHKSIPRNPLIANAFFLIKNIEQWGEGTNKIVRWCLEHGLKEPDFEEIGGGFEVRFYAPEDILSLIPEPTKVDLRELGLNKRQIEALELLVNEGKTLTNEIYRQRFNVPRRTAARDLARLVETGLITKKGVGKSTHYIAS